MSCYWPLKLISNFNLQFAVLDQKFTFMIRLSDCLDAIKAISYETSPFAALH